MPLCVEPKFTIVSKNKLEQCGYKRCFKKKMRTIWIWMQFTDVKNINFVINDVVKHCKLYSKFNQTKLVIIFFFQNIIAI